MKVRKKGVVGVVGLGIMGGAFAENLVAAGWRVIGYRYRSGSPAGAGPKRRRDRRGRGGGGARCAGDHSQSAETRGACGDCRGHRRLRCFAPHRDRGFDLRARRQTGGRSGAPQGRPRAARLSGERHRHAGEAQGYCDLCVGRRRRDQAAASAVRRLFPRGA